MKITSKGQVTIPLPIRNEFGLTPGTDVEFVAEGEKVVLKRCEGDAVEAWLKGATGVAKGKTTTAKIMKLTRGD
ncbi:MAG: AbrB/MazE/SpoVT family DNA-binding domain-containing protein [Limisphaerales bacterium]